MESIFMVIEFFYMLVCWSIDKLLKYFKEQFRKLDKWLEREKIIWGLN
jgi:hypothetical protein